MVTAGLFEVKLLSCYLISSINIPGLKYLN